MSALAQALRREARVAFSLKTQPLWFRVLKWAIALLVCVRYHDAEWFWPVAAVTSALALGAHLLYRYQTHTWTRPWGGWDDLAAGQDPPRRSAAKME